MRRLQLVPPVSVAQPLQAFTGESRPGEGPEPVSGFGYLIFARLALPKGGHLGVIDPGHVLMRASSIILAPNVNCFVRYRKLSNHGSSVWANQSGGQVAAQSFFAGPIEDKAGYCGELPAELVVTRFVGKQGLLARSGPLDPLAEKIAGLDRARRRGRDLGVLDVLRTEFAEIIISPHACVSGFG